MKNALDRLFSRPDSSEERVGEIEDQWDFLKETAFIKRINAKV